MGGRKGLERNTFGTAERRWSRRRSSTCTGQAGGADLIKGHIGTGVHSSITRIKKEEMQTKITEDNVLLISSGRATQWVFMQYDSIKQNPYRDHISGARAGKVENGTPRQSLLFM